MKRLFKFFKRAAWLAIVGLMIAFHNTYEQEFKSLDHADQEVVEEESD